MRLGTTQLGTHYAVSAIMFNWVTILYGNQAKSAHGDLASIEVSLEWYMNVADEFESD